MFNLFRQTKNKKIKNIRQVLLGLSVLCALVLISGCASKNSQTQTNQQTNGQNQEQPPGTGNGQWLTQNENFTQANLNDLEIGQTILAMGTENSDGSVSVSQIIIGYDEINFENMVGARHPLTNDNSGEQNGEEQTAPPAAGFGGQRPDFEQMQNMSEEERTAMMEKMRAQRGTSGAGQPGNRGSMARLAGEIINKDESTITLKLEEGGSKLIFFSEDTNVNLVKPTEDSPG